MTWALVTASAPWTARLGHSTVIDAAGAIYVIGGYGGGSTEFQDVWVSTDGGAERTPSRVIEGYSMVGICGITGGTCGVLTGSLGGIEGVLGVTWAYFRGT